MVAVSEKETQFLRHMTPSFFVVGVKSIFGYDKNFPSFINLALILLACWVGRDMLCRCDRVWLEATGTNISSTSHHFSSEN